MNVMTESLKKEDTAVEMVKRLSSELKNYAKKNGEADVKIKIKVDGKETDYMTLKKNGFNKSGGYIDFDNNTLEY